MRITGLQHHAQHKAVATKQTRAVGGEGGAVSTPKTHDAFTDATNSVIDAWANLGKAAVSWFTPSTPEPEHHTPSRVAGGEGGAIPDVVPQRPARVAGGEGGAVTRVSGGEA